MNGYLANLVVRTLGISPPVKPRLRSTFEPAPAVEPNAELQKDEFDLETRPNTRHSPDLESEPSSVPSVPSDSETPKSLAGNPNLAPETARLPLHVNAQEPQLSMVHQPHLSAKRRLTDIFTPDSPERGEKTESEAQAPLHRDERAETPLVPDVRRRDTRPRSVTAAPVEHANARDNIDHHHANKLAPVVKVTIGRVEVRANFSPPSPLRRQPAAVGPKLSLEDYLKSRNGGAR